MSLSIRILGTSAARPTVERNVSALAIHREGETMLFDCGEGTQRQMMRYRVSFAIDDIFFTHFHDDHILGLVGLLRTMGLEGRTNGIRLWGPRGASRALKRLESISGERLPFPVEINELASGEPIKRKGFAIVPFDVQHRTTSIGYALVEEERRGRFNPDLARELGIPEGPMWGRIHKGEPITLDDGRVIEPSTLVGPTRSGRKVVLTGDTRPCEQTVSMATDADLLIHESTFLHEDAARAVETGHSTAREAAQVALAARAQKLVLTHFSARYSRDTTDLEREAKMVFAETVAARDGMEIEVPFRDGDI